MIRLVAALIAALALLAGCGPMAAPLPIDSGASAPTSSAASTPADVAEPARVRVPGLGIDSSLTQTGMDAKRSLIVPPVTEPMQASWYSGSGRPGLAGYPGIILGHVSGRPPGATKSVPGVFAKLSKITVGAMVYIDRDDGTTARFVVTRVDLYSKSAFPAERVYADTVRPEIRLITCGGDFDASAHSYRSNVVAYAELAE